MADTVNILTKIGMARAIRDTARLAQGITDPDQALTWATNVGYIVPGPGRGELTFTERGMALAYAYWKAVEESMRLRRDPTATTETLNRNERPSIRLPDGTVFQIDGEAHRNALATPRPREGMAAALEDQALATLIPGDDATCVAEGTTLPRAHVFGAEPENENRSQNSGEYPAVTSDPDGGITTVNGGESDVLGEAA